MMSTSDEAPTDDSGPHYDCLVISDLHLGSDVCQARLLEQFLEWAPGHAKALVINGDIFDDLNFKRLTRRHFACLKSIRRNSDRADFRLIWLRGNHDGPADIISHIVGVELLDEYIEDNGTIRLLILHGDQFDTIIAQHPVLTALASGLFYYIQKWAPHSAARWIRRMSKRWQRNSELIQQRAIEYARSKDCRYVTCGHTHHALVAEVDGVRYINSGTWTDAPPCPFVAVRGADVTLEFWPIPGFEPQAAGDSRQAEPAADSGRES